MPVMLVAAAAITIESGSPVLFRQERMGENGRPFWILKFRTMRHNAGAQWAKPGDDRITRVGALLRRTSLDELPQLFNVLRGEMSIVGPRPEMVTFAASFSRNVPNYEQRHVVPPGITGWAQLYLRRNLDPSEIPGVLPYDLFYVEHASRAARLRFAVQDGRRSGVSSGGLMSLTNRVLYDGLFTFGLRVVNIVCAMGLGILTARMLGPAGKGLYALPSVEAGLIVSGFAGLGSAMTYFLLHRKTGPGILRPALLAGALFVIAGAAAIVPLAFFSGQRWAALPAILSLPSGVAICLATGYAIGVKRVRYATSLTAAVTVTTFALMLCGFFLIARTPGIAIAAWIAGNTAVAILAIAAIAIHARKLEGSDIPSLGEFTKFSVKVGLVQLVSLLNYRADLYLVAIMTTPAALGVYTVAVSAAESLLLPTQVASLVTSPHIGSFEREPAAALAARCVRNNLLVALVVCAAIFVCCSPIVKLLYGPAFMPVIPALRILLAGVFALSLASPISSYFTLKLGRP